MAVGGHSSYHDMELLFGSVIRALLILMLVFVAYHIVTFVMRLLSFTARVLCGILLTYMFCQLGGVTSWQGFNEALLMLRAIIINIGVRMNDLTDEISNALKNPDTHFSLAPSNSSA